MKKKKNKTTNNKSISLHPLSSDEALKALLETKPEKKKEKKKRGNKDDNR